MLSSVHRIHYSFVDGNSLSWHMFQGNDLDVFVRLACSSFITGVKVCKAIVKRLHGQASSLEVVLIKHIGLLLFVLGYHKDVVLAHRVLVQK